MRFISWTLIILIILGAGAFIFYRYYLADVVANAIVEGDVPSYVPENMKKKIAKIKVPLNKGAEDIIVQIHKSGIPLKKVLDAVDQIDQSQINDALNELQSMKITNTNQAFDIFKKYIPEDFDAESLREPFNKNVDMSMIKRAEGYAESYHNNEAIDTDMLKSIVKKILIQKEKEFAGNSK
jgi:hypothetical protein